ncbi:MAG: 2-phospho-L-lactate guanylyltransferase [Anaerolineaceae bacterium]|nr:2-phospho-L-lactate guanylyltransferase [Anaerolineaceae bacterium]
MCVWAIVPVKPLNEGKSRLANILSIEERKKISIFMLEHTIHVLRDVRKIDQVLIVSRDPEVISFSMSLSVRTIVEDKVLGLNPALNKAVSIAQAHNVSGVLILPADLPLITPDVIGELLGARKNGCEIRLSPDNRLQGTNAVFMDPPGILEFQFGDGSFFRHKKQAEEKGIFLQTVINEKIGLDLDLPEDYILLQKMRAIPKPI